MKHIIVLATLIFSGFTAQASVSKKEFLADFVGQMNDHLVVVNRERSEAHKQVYCSSLNASQVKMIESLVNNNPEITVEDFAANLADTLKCYPEFWPAWGRRNLPGMLTNTKAYVMDTLLIRDVIEDLSGAVVDGNRKLLDSYSN